MVHISGRVWGCKVVVAIIALSAVFGCRNRGSVEPVQIGEALIKPPIEITDVRYFSDGGTAAIDFTARGGEKFQLCFDGRLLSDTPSRIYFGAEHPTKPGATLIAAGSEQEKGLLALLKQWLDRNYFPEKQEELRGRTSVDGLPKKELWALRILWAMQGQQRVAEAQRRLDEKYSAAQQEMLLSLAAPDDLNEPDRHAWEQIQSLHGYPGRRQ